MTVVDYLTLRSYVLLALIDRLYTRDSDLLIVQQHVVRGDKILREKIHRLAWKGANKVL